MPRSSSTMSRWGASSASGAGRADMRGSRSAKPACGLDTIDQPHHPVAAVRVDHGGEKLARGIMRAGADLGERLRDASGLQAREPQRELGPLRGRVEQALAAIALAFLLLDVAFVDQLLEHAAERLLGDLENVEQRRDLHTWVAIDEMQHAMVGTAEAELRQHLVGIADEVAIGEEQQLDQVPDRLSRRLGVGLGRGRPPGGIQIYVSHVDIFWFVCYPTPSSGERIVLAGTRNGLPPPSRPLGREG